MPSNGPHLQRLISGVTGELFANDFRSFLRMIDSLVQLAVISKTLATPPGSPANGDRYIVAASPTGAWTGYANNIVTWTTDDPNFPTGFWDVHTPNAGFLAYNVADATIYLWGGSSWSHFVTSSTFVASGASHAGGLVPDPGATAGSTKFLREDATFALPASASPFVASGTSHAAGLVPDPGATAGSTKFLREDATFAVPASASTFVASGGSHAGGLVPDPGATAGSTKFLREDATFAVPAGAATAFTGLSDVPASYSGAGGKAVEVNSGATALVFSAKPFDVSTFAPGLGSNSQILLRVKLARAVTFPASATLSQASASANATGSTTFTLKKNGTSFATVNYAASSSSGTWTQASDAVFAAGDLLEIDGPATADATLANVGITLAGVRA